MVLVGYNNILYSLSLTSISMRTYSGKQRSIACIWEENAESDGVGAQLQAAFSCPFPGVGELMLHMGERVCMVSGIKEGNRTT